MNEQMKKLAEQSGFVGESMNTVFGLSQAAALEKFARLIVLECVEHCKGEMMDKKLAEEAGLTYNDGVMDCAVGLLLHFGVE